MTQMRKQICQLGININSKAVYSYQAVKKYKLNYFKLNATRIACRYSDSLRATRFGVSNLVVEKDFPSSTPVKISLRTHQTSRYNRFPGIRRPARGFDHPTSSRGEVENKYNHSFTSSVYFDVMLRGDI